jgi:hypothetical protein
VFGKRRFDISRIRYYTITTELTENCYIQHKKLQRKIFLNRNDLKINNKHMPRRYLLLHAIQTQVGHSHHSNSALVENLSTQAVLPA